MTLSPMRRPAHVPPSFSPRYAAPWLGFGLLAPLIVPLAGCAGGPRPAPRIALDVPSDPVGDDKARAAALDASINTGRPSGLADAPSSSPTVGTIVAVPTPLPLPSQLKPAPEPARGSHADEAADPRMRVASANAAARVQPRRDLYLNATQVWPFLSGALYQLYTAPGHVSDIALEPGEALVSVSAGDTVRWIVGDTTSGAGTNAQVHILAKPTMSGLSTNLVINSDRRTYYLELSSTPASWMASVSWSYPADRLLALRGAEARAAAAASVAAGLAVDRLRFRYSISGARPAWRPLRAFDDGAKVYIQFPPGIAQGELPPLFLIGPAGETELVNYRVRGTYMIVDRLFGAAELRLGDKRADIVRIERGGDDHARR